MLKALLKRRETTASALSKAREQVQELRGQLRPLVEEGHRLGLQKVCLEERLELMQKQRQEDIKQYKVMEMLKLGIGYKQTRKARPFARR
jgi:syncoilin-1